MVKYHIEMAAFRQLTGYYFCHEIKKHLLNYYNCQFLNI